MTGDQFKPIEAPYLKQWQERMAEKPVKSVKVKHKKGKKAKVRK